MHATVDPADGLLLERLESSVVRSSRVAGWTSALVERHRTAPGRREVETLPTRDLHLVTTALGRYDLQVFAAGRWGPVATHGPATVGLTPGGDVDRLRSANTDPFDVVHLFVPARLVDEAADELRPAGPGRAVTLRGMLVDDPVVTSTASALLRAAECGAPELYAQQAVTWLATHVLTAHAGCDPRGWRAAPARAGDVALARVIELVREHYDRPLSLDVLAAEACLSKFHFSRLFRERVGTSPHAFLEQTRMRAARRLLGRDDMPVAEVARRTGYARSTQFGSAFKRVHAMTPGQFRRRARDRDADVPAP